MLVLTSSLQCRLTKGERTHDRWLRYSSLRGDHANKLPPDICGFQARETRPHLPLFSCVSTLKTFGKKKRLSCIHKIAHKLRWPLGLRDSMAYTTGLRSTSPSAWTPSTGRPPPTFQHWDVLQENGYLLSFSNSSRALRVGASVNFCVLTYTLWR